MVDSMSTWSSLEITRNPFDSGREERTNCPGFSPSMFCSQETPGRQKKRRSFRWSIEQISRLNPADIDEFPIQEYSSTFEREEDEIAAQKAVDEYFSQSSIVPSPWTPNHGAKHVKFSPLPPATAYIEAESSVESSYSSPSSTNCKTKADASSQTKLSLPPDFDLQNHLGSSYYNQDGLNGSKDISLSSLRRKLFTQVEIKDASEKDPLEIKSILKSPKSPVLIDSMLLCICSVTDHRSCKIAVTSSPMSDQSTPRRAIKNRHSTASTMSSPNISPIKPLLSVPETPTSTRRPYLSRQSLSPMECSTSVFESSGIEIIGDALPDLSPIKANSRKHSNQVREMDLETETEHVENPNTSLDDGGPLEVSALSVKDDNEGEEEEVEDIDNDDDEMPPKITMEDLADDLDSTEENGSAHSTDSPQMKFEELTPRVEAVPDENAATEAMDTENVRSESPSAEHPELPKERSIENVGSNFSQEPKGYDHRNEHPGLRKYIPNGHRTASSQQNWQTKNYSTTGGFHKSSHLNELDEDVIMMRAKAALRRANRFSPTQGVSSYSYDPHSLTLSDLSLNVSSAWEPVRMSTPLAPHLSNPGNYRSHRDHDSRYGYKSISRSHRHDGAGVTYSEESGLGRSGGDMASHYSHGFSGRRLSPAVEDIIRRRKFQGGFEGRYPLSTSWKKSSSPLFSSKYDGKWQLSHTHPMSYVEWKALYWRPPRDHFTWRDHQYQTSQYGYESDLKRSSWPARPISSKLIYGSRPLSPPVTFPPAKVPRAVPGGFVSKIPLPSYQDNSDSGYSDWQRGGSQWENTVRSQHSSMGYAGEFQYY